VNQAEIGKFTEGVGQAKDDPAADLGEPEQIGQVFTGFQRHLYESAA
jgi:hypothetical protein